jgi:hypothetical protein
MPGQQRHHPQGATRSTTTHTPTMKPHRTGADWTLTRMYCAPLDRQPSLASQVCSPTPQPHDFAGHNRRHAPHKPRHASIHAQAATPVPGAALAGPPAGPSLPPHSCPGRAFPQTRHPTPCCSCCPAPSSRRYVPGHTSKRWQPSESARHCLGLLALVPTHPNQAHPWVLVAWERQLQLWHVCRLVAPTGTQCNSVHRPHGTMRAPHAPGRSQQLLQLNQASSAAVCVSGVPGVFGTKPLITYLQMALGCAPAGSGRRSRIPHTHASPYACVFSSGWQVGTTSTALLGHVSTAAALNSSACL